MATIDGRREDALGPSRGMGGFLADIFRYTNRPLGRLLVDGLLAARALVFVGRRYVCPCCGWRLRAFTHGGMSLRVRPSGYCPRCNSKARHRRDWLLLESNTDLFAAQLRLLHVSPKYSLARRFARMKNIDYVAGDLEARPHVSMRFDLISLPLQSETFDAAICIHVLEHVEDDRQALREIFRVLKPGGWTLISAPIRLDHPTYEDATIVAPADRLEAFGETDHVRWYGHDLADRLTEAGFTPELHRASDIDEATKERFGLLSDENVFLCRKPHAH